MVPLTVAILKIYEDSRAHGTCRSCHAHIEWAQLISGARMPFDYPITVTRVHPAQGAGERAIADVDTEVSFSHFATCPDAERWRKGRRDRS